MGLRLYIRQGGAPASEVEFTSFTDRKGAAVFDAAQPALSMGMRYADGEPSGNNQAKIMDPEGEMASDGFRMPAHSLVTLGLDIDDCFRWIHRGRVNAAEGGRGVVKAADEVDFDLTSEDGNAELGVQTFTADWVRPEESDYDRIVALQAYTLNGVDSTALHHRDTCQVVAVDSHLCKDANTVTMPAKTYPLGTNPREVIEDCATTAGKQYGVVLHEGPYPGTLSAYEHFTWESGEETVANPYPGQPTQMFFQDLGEGGFDGAEGTTHCGDMGNVSGDNASGRIACTAGATYGFDVWVQAYGESFPCTGHGLVNNSGGVKWYDSSDTLLQDDILWSNLNVAQDSAFLNATGTFIAPVGAVYFTLSQNDDGLPCEQQHTNIDEVVITSSEGGTGIDACDHLCLQYIVPNDMATNPSPCKISDAKSEWDPDDLSAPVFEPIWDQGKATIYEGGELASAIVSRWGVDTSSAVFVEDTATSEAYEYWCESYDDPDSVNATQAGLRASAILSTRLLTHVTHRVSVLCRGEQLPLIRAGMSMQIKAIAALGGDYAGLWQTRRIAECMVEPASPHPGIRREGDLTNLYWAHLNLDRPPMRARLRKGKAASAATTPHTAVQMPYTPPGGSSLTSTNVQDAIDELEALIAGLPGAGAFLTAVGGGKGTVQNHSTLGSTETVDLANGNYHYGTLNANCTFTFSGATASKECWFTLELTEDGTGGYSPTWPGSVVWVGGTTPTHPTTAGTTTIYAFFSRDGGTTWFGGQLGAGAGSSLTVKDEGSSLATAATSLDFVGAGVTASGVGAAKTITIPGGASASDTSMWRPLMDGAGNVVTDAGTGEAIMVFS